MLHWNLGSLRKHKPSALFSVSLSNYYVIVKAFSRNISGSTNLAYSKKVNLQVPVILSFQDLPLFLGKGKSAKITYFATGHCFIHPPLIFATQSLILSLQHFKLCISLLSQNPWTLCKKTLLIVRVILHRWSEKTLILSSLRF